MHRRLYTSGTELGRIVSILVDDGLVDGMRLSY